MKLLKALQNPSLWPWLIIIPGAILRGWNLTSSPLWYDEAFTAILAGLPTGRMLAATAADVHPPVYYLMASTMVELFGNSAAALRSLSLVFSILALIDFMRVLVELPVSRGARLAALAVLAFHPVQIYYAQEARMYALLQWLVIMQVLYMLQRRWVWLGFYTTLALYTHNYALIYSGLIGLAALARELLGMRPRPAIREAMASIAIPGVMWLPWLAVILSQMETIRGHYWLPAVTLGSTLYALFQILAGLNVADSLIPVTAFSLTAGLALLLISGLQARRHMLLLLAFGPVALAVIGSLAWQPVLLFRALLPTAPAVAALAGDGLARSTLRGRLIGLALLLPFAAASIWQLGLSEYGLTKDVPPYPLGPVSLPVVHLDDATLILSRDPAHNWLLDAGCPQEAGALSEKTRAALGIKSVSLADLPARFIFVGQVYPLSTACHEDIYKQLTSGRQALARKVTHLGEWGVYEIR